jgi:peptidoglycan/xylan/chitin deacetylase (PgdA/CDA1 family)
MTMSGPRDFVGYGANAPDPMWPGGARLALNFVVNVEEGSELSFLDGDDRSETGLTELGTQKSEVWGRDLGAESMFEYGARVGVWRVFRAFAERQVPLTAFACALALERNPAVAAEIRDCGFDVCAHGWRWERHFELDESSERERIRRAVASIEATTGTRPYGWYCRYAPSVNTRRLLVEEGGFLYDSDSYADELPFWVEVNGKPHLIVPYSLATNDTKFVRGGMSTAEHFFTFLNDSLEVLLAEGERWPKMLSVGLHPRIVGHPGRIRALTKFLDIVAANEKIWLAKRLDIAKHWIACHPAGA